METKAYRRAQIRCGRGFNACGGAPIALRTMYARDLIVLLRNCGSLHFYVAHPVKSAPSDLSPKRALNRRYPMVSLRDDLRIAVDALSAHKLRAVLTVLGLTMGVATLMTVMTLVQGANLYVEQKIANLGTNVFRLAKTPFAVVDFTVVVKALKNKNIDISDYRAVAALCKACEEVGASASGTLSVQYRNKQTDDTAIIGYTPDMVDIDTRTLDLVRYFTPAEDRHAAYVCVIGASMVDQFFPHDNPIGRTIRTGSLEFTVIGTFQKLGSVL